MRLPLRLLVLPLLLTAGACGGDGQEEVASVNPPVAIWRPDSARAAGPTDSAVASAADSARRGAAASAEPVPSGAGAGSPPGGGTPGTTTPATPAASGGRSGATPGTGGASGAATGSAEAILLRAERAYDAVRTLRADFVQELTVPLLESTQRSRGEIFHRKPDRFLMRFSAPAGDIVVADGRYLWLYYPSNDPGQVMRTSMGQAGRIDLQREFLSNPTERFDATVVGSEVVAGRPAKVLDLVPRTPSPYREVRIWIDDRDALARRFRITENNDAVRTVELRNLQANTTLPDDLFSFTPPAGTEIFEQ